MNIAIIGATGLVGREVIKILNEKKLLKNNSIFLYASEKSKNKEIKINSTKYIVKELNIKNLENKYDFAIFSAGGKVSKEWADKFVERGAFVVDNSSAFRRYKNIPLIVPEININTIKKSKIIANPNCSTIGASLPLAAIKKIYKIKRIIISTYQAVSGAGQKGVNDLKKNKKNKFNYQIKNNLIPQIDVFLPNGYTFEEDKMNFELKKILNDNKLKISTTCVRVPIINCHSESVYVELETEPDIEYIKNQMKKTQGINFLDDILNNLYPMPILACGKDDIFVGRLRKDSANNKAISFFLSFDNIRKGAALNAVQIIEFLITNKQN